jgi:DNA-binding transcriptional ArsR family regulator
MNESGFGEPTGTRAAALFAALAHPVRLRIVEELCKRPRSVGEVAAEMKIGLSGASQHLSLLARAGILMAESHGTSRVYKVRGPRISKILDLILEFCHVHQLYGGAPEDGEGHDGA